MTHAVRETSPRQRAKLTGRITRVQERQRSGPLVERFLDYGTGIVALRWLGRRSTPGLRCGARLVVEGTVGSDRGQLVILNPWYRFVAADEYAGPELFEP